MSKFSEALSRVHKAAKRHIVRSEDISREDREMLVHDRWLQPIARGWYLLVRPDVPPGESFPWYASFWDFLGLYLRDLYGDRYCLSAENSLDLHVNSTIVPMQVIAIAERGNNTPLELPFHTSLLTYGDSKNIPEEKSEVRGVQVMNLPLALCRASPSYFTKNAKDAEIALRLMRDPAEWIHTILLYDFKRAANRIIGAYQFLQDTSMAEQISKGLEQQRFHISPENPFTEEVPLLSSHVQSPHAARISILWSAYRDIVIEVFGPSLPLADKASYFTQLANIYAQDAYNSLSIEGYRVDDDLIRRVSEQGWNPDERPQDRTTRDTLAALGYYKAFQTVKESIGRILEGASSAEEAKKHLHDWMRNLFQPMVDAHILRKEDLIGYRRNQVYIRGSRHIPFAREHLFDAMDAFYACLRNESHPAVRAVLGHFLFVYIHPYMDGNGRTARFLMNACFASGGYPWTIIQVKHRDRYFAALESASVGGDIRLLAEFIAEEMKVIRQLSRA